MMRGAKALCLGLLLIVASSQAMAQTAPPNPEDQGKLALARQFLTYGKAEKDALAMLTAVRMYAGVKGTVLAEGDEGKAGKTIDLHAILDEAATYAGDDEHIKALIEETRGKVARAPKSRGVCVWAYYCNVYGCWYAWQCRY